MFQNCLEKKMRIKYKSTRQLENSEIEIPEVENTISEVLLEVGFPILLERGNHNNPWSRIVRPLQVEGEYIIPVVNISFMSIHQGEKDIMQ